MELHPATLWEALADTIGDRPALVCGPTRRSWEEFDSRAARLAGALAEHGIGQGSHVGQLLYNTPEYLETYAATLKLRAVPFNINYRYTASELAYLLDNADADALFYDASLRNVVTRAVGANGTLKLLIEVGDGAGGPAPDGALDYEQLVASHHPALRIARDGDDVTMIYTGGTTGMPKGVVTKVGPALRYVLEAVPPLLGHGSMNVDDVPGFAATVGADRLVALPASPLMHNTGLAMGALPALDTGGTVVLCDTRHLDAAALWDAVERERVTNITIVGDAFARPMLAELRQNPERDLTCLSSIGSSGAMFSTEVKVGLFEHLPQAVIVDLIGASEGVMGLSLATAQDPGETGRFRPAPGVIVVSPEGKPVAPGSGEQGLIALPGGAEGYYKDAEKSATTFKAIEGRRFTLPGDWATVEVDGTIQLLGRGSQCINTAGEKVFPEEVEEALKALPGVEDAVVFGLPDERLGQRVVGVISRSGAARANADHLVDALRDRLAAYKLPKALLEADEVPRTLVGKADYEAARRLFDATTVPDCQ